MERQIGGGFGSVVYETSDGFIRCVARTPETQEAFAAQCRFLPFLSAHVPVSVPVPVECGGRFLVYRKIPGQPLDVAMLERIDQRRLAKDIAVFLRALHRIPVDDAIAWGVPARSRTEQLLAAADRVIPLMPERYQIAARGWRDSFVERDHADVVIHGDLWYENLLIEKGALCGVVDFEHASIGDPAWDIATQLHASLAFARMVLEEYATAAEIWQRAQALFQLRAFEGLDWAARNGDTAEFAESLEKLQSVGVLP